MNERMHRYLDGELRREELTPEELQEIATCEDIIRQTGDAHRSIEVPDLTTRVMTRLPAEAPARIPANGVAPFPSTTGALSHLFQDTLGWLWKPRLITFRPAYGMILAVAALLLVVIFPRDAPLFRGMMETSVRNADVNHLTSKVFVQFRLDAPQASAVRVAGSFTGWEPAYTLQQVTPGVWSILIPLEPGVHDYAFVVNGGEWVADPAAPAVDDGFGGVSSRILVLLPSGFSQL